MYSIHHFIFFSLLVFSNSILAMYACKTVSNSREFNSTGEELSQAKNKVIADCKANYYTNKAQCAYNADCNIGNRYEGKYSCRTLSSGRKFNSYRATLQVAKSTAISRCKNNHYTNKTYCSENLDCLEGKTYKSRFTCKSYGIGREFIFNRYTMQAAKASASNACREDYYTIKSYCSSLTDCNEGISYQPKYTCIAYSNSRSFKQSRVDKNVTQLAAVASCKASYYANQSECNDFVDCSENSEYVPKFICQSFSGDRVFEAKMIHLDNARKYAISLCKDNHYSNQKYCSSQVQCKSIGEKLSLYKCSTRSSNRSFNKSGHDLTVTRSRTLNACLDNYYTKKSECRSRLQCNAKLDMDSNDQLMQQIKNEMKGIAVTASKLIGRLEVYESYHNWRSEGRELKQLANHLSQQVHSKDKMKKIINTLEKMAKLLNTIEIIFKDQFSDRKKIVEEIELFKLRPLINSLLTKLSR